MEDKNFQELINLYRSGKLDIVEKKVNELIKKYPNSSVLYNISGAVLANQEKLDEAVVNYKKSIKINPNYAEAYNNLASALYKLGLFNESVDNCQKAIQIKPDLTQAYNNLGAALQSLNKLDEALLNYEKAIKINDNFAEAYHNLSSLLKDVGRIDDARTCFHKLINLKHDEIGNKINSTLLIAPIVQSVKEINLYRSNYEKGIESLKQYKYLTEKPGESINLDTFYLSYHGKDNLEIIKKTSDLFRQIIPNINYISKNIKSLKNSKKVKVGFISKFLTNHTIGKLFGGLIKNIDKRKFDIIIFHTLQTQKSLIKNEIDNNASKVVLLSDKIQKQQQQVEKENLDIIFYPDIGMSSTTYFLAFSRLAPVQIVSYGHPETTGINTIDYFLSSTLSEIEPNKNEVGKRYSEKLICLSQFPLYYEPTQNLDPLKNRKDLKLPENARLYGCVQTLFKLHPDFDAILAEILVQDSKGYIVLIAGEGKEKFWSETLKKRWFKSFPILNERVLFLKKLSLLEYISLCDCVNVLLDPLHFGGGNSFLESMLVGTPTITMPGKYLRSNVTAAYYKQMKISNPPIVQNSKEYINLAITLAQNNKKNLSLRNELKIAANKYLFNNSKALREFEQFLEEAHKAAQLGNKLKDGHTIRIT